MRRRVERRLAIDTAVRDMSEKGGWSRRRAPSDKPTYQLRNHRTDKIAETDEDKANVIESYVHQLFTGPDYFFFPGLVVEPIDRNFEYRI